MNNRLSDRIATILSGNKPWLGFEFYGVLAKASNDSTNGEPIPEMVDFVKNIIQDAKYEVRIFTDLADNDESTEMIAQWLKDNDLPELKITNVKDKYMRFTFDVRSIRIKQNKGEICEECLEYMNKVDSNFSSGLAALFQQNLKGFF